MDGVATAGTGDDYAREDHVHPVDTSRAPVSHASQTTEHGIGTSSSYGHVKLSDTIDDIISAGIAATPKVVKDSLDEAKRYAEDIVDQTLQNLALEDANITIQTSNIDRDGALPSANQFSNGRLRFSDVDNEAIGTIDSYRLTSGESGIRLIGYSEDENGDPITNTFLVGKMPDGTNVYHAADPAAFRDAINAVSASNQASQNAMLSTLNAAAQHWALRSNVINSNNATYHGHNTGLGMTNTNAFLFDFTAQEGIWTAYTTQSPQPPEKWDTYKSTTVSQVITAASGVTVSSVTYAEWGKVAMLSVACAGFSASTGTQTVGTVASGKRPVYNVYATDVNSSYAVYAQLTTAGALTVYWGTAPSTTGSYTVRFIYILA
jgi:hypothetical protein